MHFVYSSAFVCALLVASSSSASEVTSRAVQVAGPDHANPLTMIDLCAGVTCVALDQCHTAGTCNSSTGACSNPAKADGSACTDANACTQVDTCQAGVCVGDVPITCTAIDQCHTAGVCEPSIGVCMNPPKANGSACEDGNACTQTDSCQAGVCVGSTPVVCNALDSCHLAGTCNPTNGVCSNPANSSCADTGTDSADGDGASANDTSTDPNTDSSIGQDAASADTSVPPEDGTADSLESGATTDSHATKDAEADAAIDSTSKDSTAASDVSEDAADAAHVPVAESHNGCSCDLASTPSHRGPWWAGALFGVFAAVLVARKRRAA